MIFQRIVSGVVLAAALILSILWLPPLGTVAVFSLLLLVGAWEWSGFLKGAGGAVRVIFVLLAVVLAWLLWRLTADSAFIRPVLWCAAAFWTLAALWILFLPRAVTRPIAWLAGLIVLPCAWLALARMRIDWHQGEYWLLYALCIVWFADSGAYFAGRLLGGPKLAPQVSPGKTWSGLAGGVVAAAVLAVIATPWLSRSVLALVVLTVAVALYSVVGDLTESLFKRFAGVKDSGRLIPGHGGVLDRFDSLLAAAPLLMLGAGLLGRLP